MNVTEAKEYKTITTMLWKELVSSIGDKVGGTVSGVSDDICYKPVMNHYFQITNPI